MATNLHELIKQLKPQATDIKQKIKAERWRRDPSAFIQEAVKIEDRDVVGLAIPFTLWPAQANCISVFLTERLSIILKARQLGLTWLALAYAVWNMVFKSGYSVIAISKRETPDAKELVRRVEFILRYLPKWMIREKGTAPKGWKGILWESTTLSMTIHHYKEEPSTFQSLTASKDSGRSFTANLVILDEWTFHPFAEEIYTAAYPTINRPGGGQIIGLSTGRRGTFFEKMWNGAINKENKFVPIFLDWRSDPRRNAEWYEQTKINLPNTYRAEYPELPEDAFSVGEGAFFPEWDKDVHTIKDHPGWYPPEICQIHGAYDPGYGSRACFKWYALFPDNTVVGYREYYPQHVVDSEQAETIVKMSIDPKGNPERLLTVRCDPSAWNKQSGIGKSTAEVFSEHGLFMMKADRDLTNGWRRLHQWLKPRKDQEGNDLPPMLRFTYGCANTIRTYPSCEQSKSNPDDISATSEHHAQDVDRYFVMGRPELSDEELILAGQRRGNLPGESYSFDEEEGRDEYEDAGISGSFNFYGI